MNQRAREIWPMLALLTALACSPAAPAPPGSGPGNSDGGTRADGAAPTDGSGQPPGSANTVACQRLKAGPFSPLTSQATYTYKPPLPPTIQNIGQSYRITLPAPKVGWVSFNVPAAGEYVIFTSRAVPITVFTWDGTQRYAKAVEASVPECTEVKGRESFDLQTDNHVIRLGGSDSSETVDIVLSRP